MSPATITRPSARMTAFGEVELIFPFCQDLVDALKSEIPRRSRKWDPDDQVWRVMGAWAPTAIDLLLEYFPNAEMPDNRPRRMRSSPARTERPPAPLPLPPVLASPSVEDDHPERDHLVASVRCPKCHTRHDQPVRVVAESSFTVAKREKTAPEFIAVCPGCNALAVVAFYPAAVAS